MENELFEEKEDRIGFLLLPPLPSEEKEPTELFIG